jgi:DNA-binding response OmpR family regulator
MQTRILLIDDDPDFCETVTIMLEHAHYKVITASDGFQGLKIARARVPDLILLDVVMPGKDGYVICRELKDDPRTCHIPVIIITSLESVDENGYVAKIARHHKADAFMKKPLTREFLLDQVERMLSGYKQKNVSSTKKRLLIVDDDADFVNALEILLKSKNYEIFVAESGIEGLKIAQAFCPDAIILDVMLPDMDGYTVCYELKKNPSTHDIPVMIMTALPRQIRQPGFARDMAKNHLADEYDTKPIEAHRFLNKISALLGGT